MAAALSNAERQRRHYERQKLAASAKSATQEQTRPFLREPFFPEIENNPEWETAEIAFLMIGLEPPTFTDDRGPAFPPDLQGLELPTHLSDSVGRAELIVECLLDAATAIAGMLNRYKRRELSHALTECEQTGLHDPFVRKEAEAKIQRIKKLEQRLDRNVRWTLPEWKVKGE